MISNAKTHLSLQAACRGECERAKTTSGSRIDKDIRSTDKAKARIQTYGRGPAISSAACRKKGKLTRRPHLNSLSSIPSNLASNDPTTQLMGLPPPPPLHYPIDSIPYHTPPSFDCLFPFCRSFNGRIVLTPARLPARTSSL